MIEGRLQREGAFHDDWAASVRPEDVMVRQSFEAVTAPEHRQILKVMGDLRGRRVLDLGCGLGEAAVYFATKGAIVTASDLSPGMLDVVSRVAAIHGVAVTCQCAPAERTALRDGEFDVVYAGNVLHHVDTAAVLDEALRVLKPGGLFVSWDPLAHNPVINVYRRMAMAVRTEDEHPLRMSDVSLFQSRLKGVQFKTFWLTTLLVFLRFYLVERVHPSTSRYWKKILTDAERLAPFYARLERWDARILRVAPWLGRYCWNIVIWGTK